MTPPMPAWRDRSRPAAERVERLLAELTLEEKVAQLGSVWVDRDARDEAVEHDPLDVAPMQNVLPTVDLAGSSRHGLGHLTRPYGSVPVSPADGAAELVRQHRVVLGNSRLGIPALVHEECLTGFTAYGATVYPTALAWGATWDPALVERMAAAIGRDMAALGVHQGLSPVLDVVRDYRWGRVEETIGEDPYLVATVGSAYVRGLQSAGVLATLKHFAGYSASRAARNHGPVSMGRRELLDVILPPFETAVREAGVASVMNSYADVDGVPAGADEWLLTEVLRDAWGFDGTVVSDYWAVPFLATMHRVAADPVGAGPLALAAGIDVELPETIGYGQSLVDLVRSGQLSEDLIDRAARRLLRHKAELGLLDPEWTPEGSVTAAAGTDLDANRPLARQVAEQSVVLLDPAGLLPLAASRIAVVGPCADDPRVLMGCYAFPNHVLPRFPALGPGIELPTPLAALRAGFEVTHAPGCAVLGDDRSGFDAAVAAARDAEVCVAFVGDLAGLFGRGSSGEGCDAADLSLPGVQADLLRALLATGTPLVVVVVSGRPYALGELAGRAALVQAFFPGEEGAAAIAGVLSGRLNPSGRLPVQIPRVPGGQPNTYLQPPLGGPDSAGISTIDPVPLFPFGYGRSYTSFELSDFAVDATEVPTDGEFTVSVRVRNTGDRAGAEVVQLYLHDVLARVARPVLQLTGYARVPLEPGASAEVRFRVHADRVAYTDRNLERIVEPGDIEVAVGTSAADLSGRGKVTLTGPVRVVGADRRLLTPVEIG